MQNFIRVTKDNPKRDRGFIAVDAICSVFENQEEQNTQIMTMDGMWYDVVDGIEHLYSVCENYNAEVVEKNTKSGFIRKRRMQVASLSEKSSPVITQQPDNDSRFKRVRTYGNTKRFRKSDDRLITNQTSSDFSPGGEEGNCIHNPKDVTNSEGESV